MIKILFSCEKTFFLKKQWSTYSTFSFINCPTNGVFSQNEVYRPI